jgi:phenylpropionate dioxygenase-like ring-hydroxylating dioxygenase large terminal subunit
MLRAPPAASFPEYPASWYLLCRSHELRGRPLSREMLGRRIAAFRTADGRAVVLDARCYHLGADLGRGQVVGDAIQCPFHQWEYGSDGRCTRIPVTDRIPPAARQTVYPVVERHGYIFFFNAPQALFPIPFFAGVDPNSLVAARPFQTVLDCPWYMVGSNAFDLQHFRAAHDRRLIGDPKVTCPHAFARRASACFRVAGDSLQDKITRLFAGNEVTMAITDWSGNLLFATATFRRTTSYGMVATEPLSSGKVVVCVVVFVPRSSSRAGRLLLDPLAQFIKRYFIKKFLSSDASRLAGVRYSPCGLIDWDKDLAEYFTWLVGLPRAVPNNAAIEASVRPSNNVAHASPAIESTASSV